MPINFPTSATLTGAQRVTNINFATKQEDLGAKVERLISAVNQTQSAIAVLTARLSSMISTASGIAGNFSLVSNAGLNSLYSAVLSGVALSNFRR